MTANWTAPSSCGECGFAGSVGASSSCLWWCIWWRVCVFFLLLSQSFFCFRERRRFLSKAKTVISVGLAHGNESLSRQTAQV